MQARFAPLLAIAFLCCVNPHSVAQTAANTATSPPMCKVDDLSLATDSENGNFDGMSQSGTLVVLRNIGPSACRIPAIPQLTFADGKHPLPTTPQLPGARFMHPGPVMVPVIVPVGAEVTATLHWVSGEVFEDSLCIAPTQLSVTIGGKTQTVPFQAQICGERAKGVTYQMTRFATDPVYKP